MKVKKLCVIIAVVLFFAQIFCAGCGYTKTEDKPLRLHVRADSNMPQAQAVKREVAAAIDGYLAAELKHVRGYEQLLDAVNARLGAIKEIAAAVLRSRGFGYGASAILVRERFAERDYGGTVMPAGEYDALIVRLGSGGGDNWWGMIYPRDGEGVRYKSFIAELFGYK